MDETSGSPSVTSEQAASASPGILLETQIPDAWLTFHHFIGEQKEFYKCWTNESGSSFQVYHLMSLQS